MERIVIVGGGVFALSAAYCLKRKNPSYEVIILEASDEIGKRIKVSGNGRCNFSNANITAQDYKNGKFIINILNEFKSDEKHFFRELNLYYYEDEEGRRYPLTNSSKTVHYLFKEALEKLKVKIITNCKIKDIIHKQNIITTFDNVDYAYDKLILASGGCSYLYSEQSYDYLKNLHLKLIKPKSSLCPLVVEEKIDKKIVGKRNAVNIKLFYNKELLYEEKGELIFKKDGISGIVVFNISSYINRFNLDLSKIILKIDFAPDVDINDLQSLIDKKGKEFAFHALLTNEIADAFINSNESIKNKVFHLKSFYPLVDSQVTSGGIDISEINMSNLSLNKFPNIYVGGEIIDVDGKCGGYNIHFAIACGYYLAKKII